MVYISCANDSIKSLFSLTFNIIMPELPEVETTLNGIKPFIIQTKIIDVIIRNYQLRWPVPPTIKALLIGETINNIERRGKYLLLTTSKGTIIIHLGMSGSMRILDPTVAVKKHDHIDLVFANQHCLRFTDPRRFGAFLWTAEAPCNHSLLRSLGPEPLSDDFNGEYLWQRAHQRKVSVKAFIMDSKIVVGVGNIYAAEALFIAGIRPKKLAGKIHLATYKKLAQAIKKILQAAIKQGGTTLKDFVHSDGRKGYFRMHLQVYGRGKQPCYQCGTVLREIRLGQRSTVYCVTCQT
jgi:formamidopyrimidine-DNA glycosylase